MSPQELAAIVTRDAMATSVDAAADRRALLALLRETRAALAELHHGADCTCPYSIEPADLAAAEYRMSALAALGPP